MARKSKTKKSPLKDFSSRFVKLQGLPNGTEVRLYRRRDHRRVRSDLVLERKLMSARVMEKMDDDKNVRDVLNFARSLLLTPIEDEGFEMILFGSNGERLNGNVLLRNVRLMPPKPFEGDDTRVFELLSQALQNAGFEEPTLGQTALLFHELDTIVDGTLMRALLANESRIWAKTMA
jgi:hypothetical protein